MSIGPMSTAGRCRLAVDWRLLDGRWEPVGLAIAFAAGAALRPLRASDLSGLRLPLVVEAAGAGAAQEPTGLPLPGRLLPRSPWMTSAEYRKRLLAVRRREEALEAGLRHDTGAPGHTAA